MYPNKGESTKRMRHEQRRLANINRRNEFYKPILDDIRARERGIVE